MPQITGKLAPALARLLNDQGRHNLAHPQFAWTSTDVFDDLYYLMDRNIPANAGAEDRRADARAARAALAGSPQLAGVDPRPGGTVARLGLSARGADSVAARLPGRDQRLGVVVPPVPQRVPAVRRRGRAVRAPGRVPRRRHQRQRLQRTLVPGLTPGQLPQLPEHDCRSRTGWPGSRRCRRPCSSTAAGTGGRGPPGPVRDRGDADRRRAATARSPH